MTLRPTFLPVMAALVLMGTAYAQSGTVTFNGEVSTPTCEVSFNGVVGNDPVIALPVVPSASLRAGTSAGRTPIIVQIRGDDPVCSDGRVVMTLNPLRTDQLVNGRLANGPVVNPAGNVVIGMVDGEDRAIDLTDGWSATPVPLVGGGAEIRLSAEYFAEGADANPGNVGAGLSYTLSYP